jgi:hypothetical protein
METYSVSIPTFFNRLFSRRSAEIDKSLPTVWTPSLLENSYFALPAVDKNSPLYNLSLDHELTMKYTY